MAACAAVEFEQRPQRGQLQLQLHAATGGGDDPDGVHYYGRPVAVQQQPATDEESSRTHHGKHKLKKLKKRLLLQCLLGHGRRRRRDTDAASGRFLLPVVLQSTNVNVQGYGGGSGTGGGYGDAQHQYGGSGCMEMMLNDHGPLLGSLGSGLGGLLGSPSEDAGTGGGSRSGLYAADWNRYARQFHRNYVRPLYRLF